MFKTNDLITAMPVELVEQCRNLDNDLFERSVKSELWFVNNTGWLGKSFQTAVYELIAACSDWVTGSTSEPMVSW